MGPASLHCIGFTYEAAIHCVTCAEARFGLQPELCLDNEGNRPTPVYDVDDFSPAGEDCGTPLCVNEIAEPYLPNGYEVWHNPTDYQPERNGGASTDDYPDGWYWWACQPGCLPDGEPQGPFQTEAEAVLACAREHEGY